MVEEKNMTDEQFSALFRHLEMLTPVSIFFSFQGELIQANRIFYHLACFALFW